MNKLFDGIYDCLSLQRLPGIVAFEQAMGQPLSELPAANDYYFGEQFAAENFAESFAGGSLDSDAL